MVVVWEIAVCGNNGTKDGKSEIVLRVLGFSQKDKSHQAAIEWGISMYAVPALVRCPVHGVWSGRCGAVF